MKQNDSNPNQSISSYIEHLPAILQTDPVINQFLLGFEKILSSNSNNSTEKAVIIETHKDNPPRLETILDIIHKYFNPQESPADFLPWLAGWVGLSLRDDWDENIKRAFIQQMIRFYRLRGTKTGLREILANYLNPENSSEQEKNIDIFDQFAYLPNYFQVQLTLSSADRDNYWRQVRIAKAIIDQEKPAHTFYSLRVLVPTMQITTTGNKSVSFTLFDLQKLTLELEVIFKPTNLEAKNLENLLKIDLESKSDSLHEQTDRFKVDRQSLKAQYTLDYQQFLDTLEGLKIRISNQYHQLVEGTISVKLIFKLNHIDVSETLINSTSISLPPVLKIYRQENGKPLDGNTQFLHPQGMRITPKLWSDIAQFTLFPAPENIKITLKATLTIQGEVPPEVLNKMIIRFCYNDYSHLFTPDTEINGTQKTITETITYQTCLEYAEDFKIIVKNLNERKISATLKVEAIFILNQKLVTKTLLLLDKSFEITSRINALQIYLKDSEEKLTGNTFLGTTTQSIK